MTELSIAVAFAGGLVSFLSPCVLPVIPGYLSYLAGATTSEIGVRRRDIFLAALFFVIGFSAIFSVLGVLLNTTLENVAYNVQLWLSRIGGAIMIFFGLYLTGLVELPFLARDFKFPVAQLPSRHLTSFVFGAAFAAGWTPCVGPVLGSILGLAAAAPQSAFALLFSYTLGLGVPFLAVGIFTSQAVRLIQEYRYIVHYINVFFGVVLIAIGILAFTQNLALVANLEILNQVLLRQ